MTNINMKLDEPQKRLMHDPSMIKQKVKAKQKTRPNWFAIQEEREAQELKMAEYVRNL